MSTWLRLQNSHLVVWHNDFVCISSFNLNNIVYFVLFKGVHFVPSDLKQPVCYLVAVHRLDVVRQMRTELIRMIGEDDTCDLIIAEVLDHHVARILVSCHCQRFSFF